MFECVLCAALIAVYARLVIQTFLGGKVILRAEIIKLNRLKLSGMNKPKMRAVCGQIITLEPVRD